MSADRFGDMVRTLLGEPAWMPPPLPGHAHGAADSQGDPGLAAFQICEQHAMTWRALANESVPTPRRSGA